MCNATNNILLQTIVPDAVRGRVLSVLLLNKGLVQLGTAGVAMLAALIGVNWALLLSGGVVVAVGDRRDGHGTFDPAAQNLTGLPATLAATTLTARNRA